nr:uncharacterized protein LOC113692225 isoform X2 [Coffea arabica]XP_027066400.1 uncharacterized protein LOC113692225 isoform X2 [Coffea arabica]
MESRNWEVVIWLQLKDCCCQNCPGNWWQELQNDCSGQGICNRQLGQCRCFHGFGGEGCSERLQLNCNYSGSKEDPYGRWVVSICSAHCDATRAMCFCGEGTKYPNRPVAEGCGFVIIRLLNLEVHLLLIGQKLMLTFSQLMEVGEDGVTWIQRKLMMVKFISKKNVIASMMASGADSVRFLYKVSVLTNVLVMGTAVVDFVSVTKAGTGQIEYSFCCRMAQGASTSSDQNSR